MKPIIKWSGGKTDELDEIMKHVPESYDTYVEPFVGGGALFFHLAPQKAVINDVHSDLVNLYSEIKNGNGNQIWNLMDASEFTEEEYYKVRDVYTPSTPTEKAFQFYYLRKTCYRGMLRYNKKGKFNIPYGRYANFHSYLTNTNQIIISVLLISRTTVSLLIMDIASLDTRSKRGWRRHSRVQR